MLTAQIVFPQPTGIPGGTQTHVAQLITDLAKHEGIHSIVISGRSAEFTKNISHLANVYELFDNEDKLSLSRVRGSIRWMKDLGPSIIHSHGYESNWFALIARRVLSTKGRRVPWIATIHGWIENSPQERLKAWLDRVSLLWADGVIAVAPGQFDRCVLRKGCPKVVIPNGVDVEYYSALSQAGELRQQTRLEWQIPVGGLVIGTAGRLSPEKGLDVFCNVAAYLTKFNPNIWFVIAGDGSERDKIVQNVRLLGLESRFRFVGTIEDMRKFYFSLDIFLMTSRVEGTPRVLLEAMSSSVPVVSTDVGGVPMLIPFSVRQYVLAPVNDVEGLAVQVLRLLENPALRFEVSDILAKHTKKHFSSKKIVRQIRGFYDEVISSL